MNFGQIMVGYFSPETSFIGNIFSAKIIRIRFASFFQEFFTKISLGPVVLFVSIGSIFLWVL